MDDTKDFLAHKRIKAPVKESVSTIDKLHR